MVRRALRSQIHAAVPGQALSDLLSVAVEHVISSEERVWTLGVDMGLCVGCLSRSWQLHSHRDLRFPFRALLHPWVMFKIAAWRKAVFVLYEDTGYEPAWSYRRDLTLWLGTADLYVHRAPKSVFNYAR